MYYRCCTVLFSVTLLPNNPNLLGQYDFCFIVLRLIRPILIIQKNCFEIVFFLKKKNENENENEEIERGDTKSLNFVQ
jgi:hypothetical protein